MPSKIDPASGRPVPGTEWVTPTTDRPSHLVEAVVFKTDIDEPSTFYAAVPASSPPSDHEAYADVEHLHITMTAAELKDFDRVMTAYLRWQQRLRQIFKDNIAHKPK